MNSKALSRLVALISDGYPVAALEARMKNARVAIAAPAGAHPAVVALLDNLRHSKKLTRVQLVVVATGREAEDVAAALHSYLPSVELLEFPSWETLPHERLSPSAETVGKRLKVLHRLHELSVAKTSPEHQLWFWPRCAPCFSRWLPVWAITHR
jgi:transcription-repair coupling factor (superfamily II helicase)